MEPGVLRHLLAFAIRWLVSAVILMLSVAWVKPGSPQNTLGRALAVSLFLALAWYLTLARFLWWLLLPWLLYVAIWLATMMGAYRMGFFQALLLAIALTIVSWLVTLLLGVGRL